MTNDKVKSVYSTKNYKVFRFITGNRPVDYRRVLRIKESMEESGWIGAPIVVSDSMEIIDGQHRLEAAKLANIPVEYVISLHKDIETIQKLNITQQKWTAIDFVRSMADCGDENYRKFIALNDEFVNQAPRWRKLSTNVIMAAAMDLYVTTTDVKWVVKHGLYLDDEQYKKAQTLLRTVADCIELFRQGGTGKFGRIDYVCKAILFMIRDGANVQRIKESITNYGSTYIPCTDIRSSVQQMEGLYNRGRRGKMFFQSDYDRYIVNRKSGKYA